MRRDQRKPAGRGPGQKRPSSVVRRPMSHQTSAAMEMKTRRTKVQCSRSQTEGSFQRARRCGDQSEKRSESMAAFQEGAREIYRLALAKCQIPNTKFQKGRKPIALVLEIKPGRWSQAFCPGGCWRQGA